MIRFIRLYILGLVALLVCACQQAEDAVQPVGNLFINLSSYGVKVAGRAAPSELPDPMETDFELTIHNTQNGEVVYEGYYLPMICLPAGTYDIHASFGDDSVPRFDNPCYVGVTKNLEIKPNSDMAVDIPCRLSNALVSVVYADIEALANYYSSYYVTVHADGADYDITDTSFSVYVKAGTTVGATFHGVLKKSGQSLVIPLKQEVGLPRIMKAAEHLQLKISVDSKTDTMSVKL